MTGLDDTEFGPQINAQAWSEGDSREAVAPYREQHSWRHVAGVAVGILLVALALAGCTVSVSAPHIPFLHSKSYRDGYSTVHSRSGSFTEKDRQQTHDAIASGYWTAQSMCRLIERGQNPQPVNANDWVDGCAAATHDDLGT